MLNAQLNFSHKFLILKYEKKLCTHFGYSIGCTKCIINNQQNEPQQKSAATILNPYAP